MRRYLFIAAIAFIAVVIFFDSIGVAITYESRKHIDESRSSYTGKVKHIEKVEEHYDIKLRLSDIDIDILLKYYDEIEEPFELYRSIITFDAELAVPSEARNPHCFNYRRYLRSEGIYYTGNAKNISIVGRDYSLYDRYLRYLIDKKNSFCNELDERVRGMVMGVVFGDTSYVSESVYDTFKKTGTAHILAVSGLHVGIFYNIFKKINGKRRSVVGLLIFYFFLFSYGCLALWRPSIIRAVVMIILSITAKMFSLRYDRLTALSFIAVILIVFNPYIIYSIAFQMSFFAILAIDVFTKVTPPSIPENISVTLSVNTALCLYQAYVFNCISFVSFFANIPVIFISGFFVPVSVFCFIFYCASGSVAPFLPFLTSSNDILITINEISVLNGRGATDSVSPPLFIVLIVGLSMLFLCSETFEIYRNRHEKKKIIYVFMLILVISTAAAINDYNAITYDDMVFIDVGQGNALHIRNKKYNVLIDGGGSYRYSVGEKTLKPYLLKNGEGSVDLALATHKDIDHYKGLTELGDCFKVKNFFDESITGDKYVISDELEIITLWPEKKDEGDEDENSKSSVFLVICKGVRTVITGDLGTEGEKDMIEYYRKIGKEYLLDADILNVGHHGSKTSTSEELLDAVSPEICIIQVGKNNYGHPAPSVVDRIKKRGILVFRNDKCGAIGIKFGKGKMKAVHTMRKANIDEIH